MGLDELTVQTIVFSHLVLAAHVGVVAELLDVHGVVEVLILEVMHVLAGCPVEPDNGLAAVWASDVEGVHGEVETVGVVDTGVGPDLVESARDRWRYPYPEGWWFAWL